MPKHHSGGRKLKRLHSVSDEEAGDLGDVDAIGLPSFPVSDLRPTQLSVGYASAFIRANFLLDLFNTVRLQIRFKFPQRVAYLACFSFGLLRRPPRSLALAQCSRICTTRQ